MRIAWLSAETPDRFGHGGQRRQYHLIRELVERGADVRVLLLKSAQDSRSIQDLTPTTLIRKARWRPRSSGFDQAVMASHADALLISHAESVRLVPRVFASGVLPVVVDMHNVLSRWYESQGDTVAAAQARREEAEILAVSSVVVSSDEECASLRQFNSDARITVVRQGFDPREWPEPPRTAVEPHTLAFFGSLWYPINLAGLRWFTTEVWPKIRSADGSGVFRIFGAGDGSEFDKPEIGIRVNGWTEDLASSLHAAAGIVIPILAGPGSRVKFPEALASGRPVISTTIGAESFAAEGYFELADDPSAFAAACLRVLRDNDHYLRTAEHARTFSLRHFTWSAAAEELVHAIEAVRTCP